MFSRNYFLETRNNTYDPYSIPYALLYSFAIFRPSKTLQKSKLAKSKEKKHLPLVLTKWLEGTKLSCPVKKYRQGVRKIRKIHRISMCENLLWYIHILFFPQLTQPICRILYAGVHMRKNVPYLNLSINRNWKIRFIHILIRFSDTIKAHNTKITTNIFGKALPPSSNNSFTYGFLLVTWTTGENIHIEVNTHKVLYFPF